jgi:hypothetical protein
LRITLGLRAHLGVLVRRPSLLIEAARLLVAVRRRRRPGPSAAYLEWRAVTAYGSASEFPPDELVGFLAWRRRMRALAAGVEGR